MTQHRRSGVLFGTLALLGIILAALFSNYEGNWFSGIPGIEKRLVAEAEDQLFRIGVDDAVVGASGRDLDVTLPNPLPAGVSRQDFEAVLLADDGVRKLEYSVPDGAPPPPAVAPSVEPDPEPTVAPEPDPSPTAEPAATVAEVVGSFDSSDITFEVGSAQLTAQGIASLDEIAASLDGATGDRIEVRAHTEGVGDPDANLLLSQQRAEAVVVYLISQGVDPALLSARGYGDSDPIADNSTEQGQAANRRVELVVEGT